MKNLVVDRFEGNYAICEDAEKKLFAIDQSELPQGTKEGDVLAISDEGTLTFDRALTEQRRKRILGKQKDLWK